MTFPNSTLHLCEVVSGPTQVGKFFIMETYWTSSGWRTRIASGPNTKEEAEQDLAGRLAKYDRR